MRTRGWQTGSPSVGSTNLRGSPRQKQETRWHQREKEITSLHQLSGFRDLHIQTLRMTLDENAAERGDDKRLLLHSTRCNRGKNRANRVPAPTFLRPYLKSTDTRFFRIKGSRKSTFTLVLLWKEHAPIICTNRLPPSHFLRISIFLDDWSSNFREIIDIVFVRNFRLNSRFERN